MEKEELEEIIEMNGIAEARKKIEEEQKSMRTNVTNTDNEEWKLLSVIHNGEIIYQRRLHEKTIPLIRDVIKGFTTQLKDKELLRRN